MRSLLISYNCIKTNPFSLFKLPTKSIVNMSIIHFIQTTKYLGKRNCNNYSFPWRCTYLYIYKPRAIFMDIGIPGYKKPFENMRKENILEQLRNQSKVSLQGWMQGENPGPPARGTSMHSLWPTFDWVFPRHFFEYKRIDPPSIIMHFEDNTIRFNLSQLDTKQGPWHSCHTHSEVNCWV